jgi:heat shock protein 1/8
VCRSHCITNHFGAYDVILAEDEAAAARIAAKNSLESFSYNLRITLSDEKLKDKFNPADKTKLKG